MNKWAKELNYGQSGRTLAGRMRYYADAIEALDHEGDYEGFVGDLRAASRAHSQKHPNLTRQLLLDTPGRHGNFGNGMSSALDTEEVDESEEVERPHDPAPF